MKAILGSLLVGLLAAAGSAQAGDLCLDATVAPNPPTADQPVIILRGFKFPKKNKCKSFSGVASTSIPSLPSAVTGSACTRFDGTGVSFTLYGSLAPTADVRAGTELRYSALVVPTGSSAGTGALSRFKPGDVVSTGPLVAFECHNAFPDNL